MKKDIIKGNQCPICRLIKKTLPPFSPMIYGEKKRFKMLYKIDLPDFSHEEKYLKLGVYKDSIDVNYCPTCGHGVASNYQPYTKNRIS